MAAWETYFEEVDVGLVGATGGDGTTADTGAWVTSTLYHAGERCTHARTGYGQSVYKAKIEHTSSAASEPEVGASYSTYWELYIGGGADGAGSGDVVGPASSTNDYLALWSGTTGKLLKVGAASISQVMFYYLSRMGSSTAIDRENDCIRLYDDSGSTYWKCPIKKIHRATETISLSARGIYARNTVNPSDATTHKDIPTTRRFLPVTPFPSDSTTYAECTFVMPEIWDGSALDATFIVTTPTATPGAVVMGIQARCVADGDNINISDGTACTAVCTLHEAAYVVSYGDITTALTPSGTLVGGAKIMFTIYRSPSTAGDTLGEDVWLTDVIIRYGVKDV